MANATFHTGCPRHPKILGLTDAAFRLWFNAILYCHEHLTDGVLLKVIVPSLKAKVTPGVLHELVTPAAGYSEPLWIDRGDHFLVHDYLEWNDSKEDVQRGRSRLRERVKRLRDGRSGIGVTPLQPPLQQASVTALKPLGTTNNEQRTQNNDQPTPAEEVWNDWRELRLSLLKIGTPLTPKPLEFGHCLSLVEKTTDQAWRRLVIEQFLITTYREIDAKPRTLGYLLHWWDWIDGELRRAGKRPESEVAA